MIVPEYRCAFVHVPKTGGISVKRAFAESLGMRFGSEEFSKYQFGHKKVSEYEIDSFFLFSTIRNPWDRAISALIYTKKTVDAETLYLEASDPERGFFYPQSYWLDREVDFLIRFENINEDFNKVCEKIGVQMRLPHTNKSNRRKNYKEYMRRNPELKAAIESVYAEDIERFGYSY